MNSRRWGDGKLSDICGDYRFVHSWHAREIESVETQLLHAVGIEHWTQVLGLQAESHVLEDEALHIPRVKAPRGQRTHIDAGAAHNRIGPGCAAAVELRMNIAQNDVGDWCVT